MKKEIVKKILVLVSILLLISALSFWAIFSPLWSYIIFGLLVVSALILTVYDLEYGLLLVFTELFIGSLGHLFFIHLATQLFSIRMALWLIVIVVFSIKFIYQVISSGRASTYYLNLKHFSNWKILGILAIFVIWGLINGFLQGHPFSIIFADFNAWLYFLLFFPFLAIYGSGNKKSWERFRLIFGASTIFLSIETLFLLFVFTHISPFSSNIYFWLRRTILGEVTTITTGWPRIFIQSQIFPLLAFFIIFWRKAVNTKLQKFFSSNNLVILVISASFLSVLLLSFSRSFWVGFLGTLFISLIIIWQRFNFKRVLKIIVWLISATVLSFILIYLISAWPYIHTKTNNFSQSIMNRADTTQGAAISSRWSLLPILTKAVEKRPLLGQGFGATLSYISHDPRILQHNPSGKYTTYAFEWAYLGLALKLGLLGLVAYLLFLLKLITDSLSLAKKDNNYLFYALSSGILFLMITNIFTPYLNHPLGIGFLVISACLIWTNRVY